MNLVWGRGREEKGRMRSHTIFCDVIVKIYESHAGNKKALLFQTKPASRRVNPVYMQPENVVPPARAKIAVSSSDMLKPTTWKSRPRVPNMKIRRPSACGGGLEP